MLPWMFFHNSHALALSKKRLIGCDVWRLTEPRWGQMWGESFGPRGCVFLKFCTSFAQCPLWEDPELNMEEVKDGSSHHLAPFTPHNRGGYWAKGLGRFCIIQQCPLHWISLQIAANKSLCAQFSPPPLLSASCEIRPSMCVVYTSGSPLSPDTHNFTTTFFLPLSIKPCWQECMYPIAVHVTVCFSVQTAQHKWTWQREPVAAMGAEPPALMTRRRETQRNYSWCGCGACALLRQSPSGYQLIWGLPEDRDDCL